ncbi:hypothetical protein H0A36_00005 [Endozoicomonas sp. SM1973]|uniref:Uncharacterized protein n=1 Tax=Spartinivicinus marinus TaxID=2994442 RepID=A0A853I446_9GAMM|nr:hypothetical protein [Spartinivicinus marinus]MCX4026531.1 hypothetical protein [Spartinivicinus marinus]NYZ64367.1 hypothetical protein [Spartinivicinus marinus]
MLKSCLRVIALFSMVIGGFWCLSLFPSSGELGDSHRELKLIVDIIFFFSPYFKSLLEATNYTILSFVITLMFYPVVVITILNSKGKDYFIEKRGSDWKAKTKSLLQSTFLIITLNCLHYFPVDAARNAADTTENIFSLLAVENILCQAFVMWVFGSCCAIAFQKIKLQRKF